VIEQHVECIVAAAIQVTLWEGLAPVTLMVDRPNRHGNIISAAGRITGNVETGGGEQGFVTSHGRFVDREEGRTIALASGQISCTRLPHRLFSEDLWWEDSILAMLELRDTEEPEGAK
jgi:hypothetical protein